MNISRIITFTILLITIAALVELDLDIITSQQMLVISVISVVVTILIVVVLAYRIYKIIGYRDIVPTFSDVKVIIPKVHISDKFVCANSNILENDITSTNPFRTCIFRISLEINNSMEQLGMSAVRLIDSKIVESTIKKRFVAKETYIIDTVVGPKEIVNFKFDSDIDIKKLLIDELYVP